MNEQTDTTPAIDRGARALAYQAHMRDPVVPPTWWDEARECLSEALDVEEMASAIWEASRADEGTISATGAKIVAKALRERLLGTAARNRNRDRAAAVIDAAAPHLVGEPVGYVGIAKDFGKVLTALYGTPDAVAVSSARQGLHWHGEQPTVCALVPVEDQP